jgi:hypothetical protein
LACGEPFGSEDQHGEEDREERCRGVQDGREAGIDVLLAPGDQQEWHDVPDHRHEREVRPHCP